MHIIILIIIYFFFSILHINLFLDINNKFYKIIIILMLLLITLSCIENLFYLKNRENKYYKEINEKTMKEYINSENVSSIFIYSLRYYIYLLDIISYKLL